MYHSLSVLSKKLTWFEVPSTTDVFQVSFVPCLFEPVAKVNFTAKPSPLLLSIAPPLAWILLSGAIIIVFFSQVDALSIVYSAT